MSGTNIITANFDRNKRQSITRKLYQGDYGQILRLKGLDLPETFQVHFSNQKIAGTAKKVIGTNNEVNIPDEYLQSGNDIFIWVITHSDFQDGETRYAITIPVIKRPDAIDVQPTPIQQDLITTAIAAMNSALEKTAENVTHYPKIIDGYWFVYDAELDEYVNTNVDAHGIKGDTGNGISSAVLNNDDTLTLTFTNGQTYTTPSIKGRTPVITTNRIEDVTNIYTDGYLIGVIRDGFSPVVTFEKNIGEDHNTKLIIRDKVGEQSTIIYNGHSPKITTNKTANDELTILADGNPIGIIRDGIVTNVTTQRVSDGVLITTDDGTTTHSEIIYDGIKGTDGVSPTVSVTEITGGHRVTITDAIGVHTADVMNGQDGSPGAKGEAGEGIPTGGTAGQILKKSSATDYDAEWADESGSVTDVQINGSSIVNDGVAEIPIADGTNPGVVIVRASNDGLLIDSSNRLSISAASATQYKNGDNNYRPVTTYNQHQSVFYGLAKAAGDTTQSASSNTVGNYTEDAKTAIQNMLDVPSKADVAAIQTMAIHICTAQEYDSTTRVPTIQSPDAKTFYLVPTVDGSSPDLFTEWVYVNGGWEMFGSASIDLSGYLTDVTVNGTSIVNNGTAEIPVADSNNLGVVSIYPSYGIGIINNKLAINGANATEIKNGNNSTKAVSTYRQHESTFYGLAKAAGDSTQSQSDNAVGTYTDDAKASIKNMLGVEDPAVDNVTINGISVVNNGVAEIPLASSNIAGVVKTSNSIGITQDGAIGIIPSTTEMIKEGANNQQGITPGRQHGSVFYGLAKAAGDTTQSQSNNSVGEYTDDAKTAIKDMLGVEDPAVTDVQINRSSILNDGVANIPVASTTNLGAVAIGNTYGVKAYSNGRLYLESPSSAHIKAGENTNYAIKPSVQHESTFYGLAKAAGDTTQSSSNNTVGNYTDDAKTAIQSMLGVGNIELQIPSGYNIAFVEDTLPEPSNAYITNPISYLLCTNDMKIYSISIFEDPEIGELTYEWNLEYTLVSSPETNKDYYVKLNDEYNHFRYNGTIFERVGKKQIDVQIDGNSILNDGIANIPVASGSHYGVVKTKTSGGTGVDSVDKTLILIKASDAFIKTGTNSYAPIVSANQHTSTFYGLAKAAGDNTQSQSANTVGNYTDEAKAAIKDMIGIEVDDVQIGGTSIVDNGVANIPLASANNFGVVKVEDQSRGLYVTSQNVLSIAPAAESTIKTGNDYYKPIGPGRQHIATFYGLAKAAGDNTQSQSANTIGTYTDEAKTSIQTMLDVPSKADVPDIQINGTNIVNDGTANIPIASTTDFGVIKINVSDGINVTSQGNLSIIGATESQCKNASTNYRTVTPYVQHISTFFGLAKAAGDTTQSASSNTVGTYTDSAKIAIQKMLGIYEAPWELIREDTFTNAEASDIEITVDNNGQAFELTDVCAMIWFPQQETEASCGSSLKFSYGTNFISTYPGATTQAANGNAKGATALITQEHGILKKIYTRWTTLGTDNNNVYTNNQIASSDGNGMVKFTSLLTFTKVTIASVKGTLNCRILGKRKWN